MKVVSDTGLAKLVQLVKAAFVSKTDVITTTEVTLATVATTGSYNDLSNKPTIPTVNNPTITITQGGVTKGSFTLNQASGDTIALDAGGGGGSSTLAGLSDVTITSATNGQALVYNSTSSKWENTTTYAMVIVDYTA